MTDYSVVDSVNYTEANVMAKVTQAEYLVNEICGQSFTGTIPDGVKGATKEYARYLMNLQMLDDEQITEFYPKYNEVMKNVYELLAKNKVDATYTGDEFDMNDL